MILRGDYLVAPWANLREILGKSWGNLGGIKGESAVDNYIIWRMSGTTSGAYCQQWIAILSAIYVCDAVCILIINIYCNFYLISIDQSSPRIWGTLQHHDPHSP